MSIKLANSILATVFIGLFLGALFFGFQRFEVEPTKPTSTPIVESKPINVAGPLVSAGPLGTAMPVQGTMNMSDFNFDMYIDIGKETDYDKPVRTRRFSGVNLPNVPQPPQVPMRTDVEPVAPFVGNLLVVLPPQIYDPTPQSYVSQSIGSNR